MSKRISELPYTGYISLSSDYIPLVQDGITKRTTLDNLELPPQTFFIDDNCNLLPVDGNNCVSGCNESLSPTVISEYETPKANSILTGKNNCICNYVSNTVSFLYNGVNIQNAIILGGLNNSIRATISADYFGGGSSNSVIGGGVCNMIESSPNSVIGGGVCNTICTICPYGPGNVNVISGGFQNLINFGACSNIVGGTGNKLSGDYASIVGGLNNCLCGGTCSSILGGDANVLVGEGSTILGGITNFLNTSLSLIGAGNSNSICNNSFMSSIVGGSCNNISCYYSFIGGGCSNIISSQYSFIGGGINNNSLGNHSVIVGGNCNTILSGNCSFIGGGVTNKVCTCLGTIGGGFSNTICSTATYATIGGGRNNTVSGYGGVIGGGQSHNSSACHSFIFSGCQNTSNNNYSGVIGGCANTVCSNFSTILGGGLNSTTSSATYSITSGQWAQSSRYGQRTHANGRFSATGDAQHSLLLGRNKTTTATPTNLFLDGSSNRVSIASGKSFFATISVAGIKSDGSTAAHYIRKVAIKNLAGTTTLIGSVSTIGTDVEDDASYDVTITADDTNDALDIKVTGKASETLRWVMVIDAIEITIGT